MGQIFYIIKSGSVGLYPYAASLLIQEALLGRNKHSDLSEAVITFLRKEKYVHANNKFWAPRLCERVVWLTESSGLQEVVPNIYAITRSEQIARTKLKTFKNPQQIVEKCAEDSDNLPIIAKGSRQNACNTKQNACNTKQNACNTKQNACNTKEACSPKFNTSTALKKDICNTMIVSKKAYHKSMILTQDTYQRFNILRKKDESISDRCDNNHLSKAKACLKWLF